jgi:hypothetical protein
MLPLQAPLNLCRSVKDQAPSQSTAQSRIRQNRSRSRKTCMRRRLLSILAAIRLSTTLSVHVMREVVDFRSDLRNFASVCRLPEVSVHHRRHLPLRTRRACCRSHLIFTGLPQISSPRVGPWCVCVCVNSLSIPLPQNNLREK